jgi:hypothetical protein
LQQQQCRRQRRRLQRKLQLVGHEQQQHQGWVSQACLACLASLLSLVLAV